MGRAEAQAVKTLPINLLIGGRRCLVVGGGAIGARKAGHLLDAGADVTVVAPVIDAGLTRLAADGRIHHEARPFETGDVDGMAVVFAATDDETVNLQVMAACRRKGVLCCTAGSHWREADFMTPAILRREGVLITVSTGGASCRRARRIKDRLARDPRLLEEDTES